MHRIEQLGQLLVVAIACFDLSAQEVTAGFIMPVTLTGGAVHAKQPPESESDATASGAMFRATLYPGLKLGARWFVYSAVQIGTQPGPSYSSGSPGQTLQARLLQAFVGYSWTVPGRSLTSKPESSLRRSAPFPNATTIWPIPYGRVRSVTRHRY
jgi:hypothetical protein